MSDFLEDCRAELECYTGKITQGDITPMLYSILRGTSDKDALLAYLGYEREDPQKIEEKLAKPSFEALFRNGREVK